MEIYDFLVKKPNKEMRSLADFRGKVLLIVNTASKCGFTKQYGELESLYKKYKDEGLVVLGFPCNQFAKQEPASDEEIQHFCQINFGVTFPVFAKIDVKGPQAEPLFRYLIQKAPGFLNDEIKWNFTKFLVDATGRVRDRFAPITTPNSIEKDIVALLAEAKK